jgi:hypothetical protein
MVKVNKKMLDDFLKIMDDYNEFIFMDDEDYLMNQLQACLNTQGYWSGCAIRVYYDEDTKEFYTASRF